MHGHMNVKKTYSVYLRFVFFVYGKKLEVADGKLKKNMWSETEAKIRLK
jgi:hypothetical protein